MTDGRIVTGTWEVMKDMTPSYVSFSDDVFTVTKISEDVWNYNYPVDGGCASIA